VPEIRLLHDNFVRKHFAGQKKPSPSALLAEADLIIPYQWESLLDEFSYAVWKQNMGIFLKKCKLG
jgi:hypothetical protein